MPPSHPGPSRPVYLDHHATTPCDPRVVEAMAPWWSDDFGNAASRAHVFGWRAEAGVEQARETIARCLGAASREIVFTSGATESDNLAVLGAARAGARAPAGAPGRGHVILSAIEHPAVRDLEPVLRAEGFDVTVAPVGADGVVDPDAIADALRDDTLVVSVMTANNEIGTLQPVEAIGALCRERGVLFHTDAAQAVGRIPFDVGCVPADLVSFCAHKLYGPKGIGALYVRRRRPRVRLEPLVHGGGHERGLRSGTLPVPLVVGFGRAVEIACEERETEAPRLLALRVRLRDALEKGLDGVHWNGCLERRLPGNLNAAFDGITADRLLVSLPDVALSTGSACASADPRASHVLLALGQPRERVRASVRFGIGRGNTEEEIDRVAARVIEAVRGARAEAPASVRRRD